MENNGIRVWLVKMMLARAFMAVTLPSPAPLHQFFQRGDVETLGQHDLFQLLFLRPKWCYLPSILVPLYEIPPERPFTHR